LAIPLNINGAIFEYPEDFDESWGISATGWAQAVTNGMLQRQGGSFPLTADVNFGTSFGLVSPYFTSHTINPATVGTVRLASADPGVGFRNNANSGNLILTTDTSDNLLYNGHILTGSSTGPVTSITGTAHQVIASAATGAVTLSLPQSIDTTNSPVFNGETLNGILFMANTNPVGFQDSGSLHAVFVKAPSTTTNYNLVLPPNAGLSGQVLQTDGTGTTTWVNATGTGTVNSATSGQLAYYASSSNAVSGNPQLLYTQVTGTSFLSVKDTAGAILHLERTSSTAGVTEIGQFNGGVFKISDIANSVNFFTYTAGGSIALVTPLDLGSHNITSVTDPVNPQDAATKNYVDAIGVFVESTSTSSTAYVTSGTPQNYVSISLGAGTWMISGMLAVTINGSTWSNVSVAISPTSGSFGGGSPGIRVANNTWANSSTTPTFITETIPSYITVLGTTTIYYLVTSATFSAGAPAIQGGRITDVKIGH